MSPSNSNRSHCCLHRDERTPITRLKNISAVFSLFSKDSMKFLKFSSPHRVPLSQNWWTCTNSCDQLTSLHVGTLRDCRSTRYSTPWGQQFNSKYSWRAAAMRLENQNTQPRSRGSFRELKTQTKPWTLMYHLTLWGTVLPRYCWLSLIPTNLWKLPNWRHQRRETTLMEKICNINFDTGPNGGYQKNAKPTGQSWPQPSRRQYTFIDACHQCVHHMTHRPFHLNANLSSPRMSAKLCHRSGPSLSLWYGFFVSNAAAFTR